ncbi:MAG: hypothetical protein EOM54_10525 [Clostridia bacterium]|nr:hypothetical protein [Clostridia bacterium]
MQQRPEFTFSSLFSGKYTSSFETYVTDQFEFRDTWTAFKARCELLIGKGENNDVYLCDGETLIEGFAAPAADTLDDNMAALNDLSENAGVPVFFALVPDKSEILAGMLPNNAPNESEKDVIDYCYSRSGAETIDILSPLAEHAGEYIFYRTDHHWTSLGAYYGYTAIADAMSLPVNALSRYSVENVSSDFFGTMWSSSGFSWVGPDSMDIFVSPPEDISITNYPEGEPVAGTLYDYDFLDKKDKYSFFLGGNTPLQKIKTGIEDAPSLLIVRDSYADSLVPFLLDDFSEIHLIDLRYYRAGLNDYITNNDIDEVLVIYSVSDFCTDTNIFLLGG